MGFGRIHPTKKEGGAMGNPSEEGNPERKTFEQLFEEMNDLLHFVIEKIESPDQELSNSISPDLGKKFTDLERDVAVFTQLNETIIEQNSDARNLPLQKSTLSKRELKCVEQAQKLIKKAEAIQSRTPLEKVHMDNPPDSEKERKKHLKRIRRGQTWKL